MKPNTNVKDIEKILNRGIIAQVLPCRNEFIKKLASGKQLRFYIGADATGKSLHLSHAKNFMLLEEFRQLGHKVFVLFGDLTACIGDPSDKDSARAKLSRAAAKENALSWASQIKNIINFDDPVNPAEIVFNSTWFDKFTITQTLELFSNATVQQMIERDMFQRRLKENKPIFLHEFLYPMFQGYDSVALDVDVEMCGVDQTFNALAGRDLLKKLTGKEKFVVVNNLMENPKTGHLMSKSNNTGVFLSSNAGDMFGQIMAQPDEMIEILLINNTRIPLDKIKELKTTNPMQAKLFTATEVVKVFFGEQVANDERAKFEKKFSKRELTADDFVVLKTMAGTPLLDILMQSGKFKSKGELKRLLASGAIKNLDIDSVIVDDVLIGGIMKVKVGKLNFFEIHAR